MKSRVKGLLALCLAMCMVLAMTTVAFGVEYKFADISDSAWAQLNVGDTVKAEDTDSCGRAFYVVDENGKYLDTANTTTCGTSGEGYSSNDTSAISSSDKSYFDNNNTFTLPAVKDLFGESYAAGYHYEAKAITDISNSNDDGVATAAVLSNTIDRVYYDSERYLLTNALMLKAVENSNYTVNFNLNGGTAADGADSIASKTNVKWTDNMLNNVLANVPNPTKEGFTFDGWWYEGERVSSGETYGNLAITEKAEITLVAQWTPAEQLPSTPSTPAETPNAPSGGETIHRQNVTATTTETPSTTVDSPKTFDAGVAVYAALSLLSAAGAAVVIGKKKEF